MANKGIDLKRDSSWTTVIDKKKRTRASSEVLIRKQKQAKISSYWLSNPVSMSNSFAPLEGEEDHDANLETKEKPIKPSSIFVDGIKNIQPLIHLLNHVKNNYKIKVFRNDQVKIQLGSSKIVKQLEIKQTEFYTYKSKAGRSFKVEKYASFGGHR